MTKQNIALVFGGPSVEHEVSVVTALAVYEALDKEKYNIIPLYIAKNGSWYTGDTLLNLDTYKFLSADPSKLAVLTKVIVTADPNTPFMLDDASKQLLKIDVALLATHGTLVENGALQGLFEFAQIPYTGPSVISAAAGFDKVTMKAIYKSNDFPITKYEWFLRSDWENYADTIITKLEEELGYPMFIKPASLGSSVGVSKVGSQNELRFAVNIACQFDRKLVAEKALENCREVNCTVIGYEHPETTELEEIITTQGRQFHDYESKYIEGGKKTASGQQRVIPADLADDMTATIKQLAKDAFTSIDNSGISRVDFLISEEGKVYLNEINTIPGMLSSYFWEKSGSTYTEALDKLIELAKERFADQKRNIVTIDSKIFDAMGGSKTSD